MTDPDTPGQQGPAAYLVAAREAETRALSHLLQMVRLVVAVSNLVHALQRERGASGIFLGTSGSYFSRLRRELISATDAEYERLRDTLSEISDDIAPMQAGSHMLNRLASALFQLDNLPAFRQAVDQQAVSAEEVRRTYTELIHTLLTLVFDAADTAPDPDITRALVALFHFMQGKELAGQERALGGMRLAGARLRKNFPQQLAALIDNQERCFETFATFADPVSLNAWQTVVDDELHHALERFRRKLTLPPGDRQQEETASEMWFETASKRIDAMKSVEDALEHHLHAISKERLERARNSLARYQRWAEALEQGEPAEPPEDFDSGGNVSQSGPALPDPPTTGLNRSVIELAEQQGRQLQDMQEALEKARAALAERKLVERAKALLMKHRGLDEEQAYTLLRKMAMNQSRRLADVARTLLAMTDVIE